MRDFFDYCLTAQSDLSATALDAFVVREIAAQLDGTVAQAEALDGWHRYRAYLDALAKLRDAGAVDKSDLGALQLALDQRASIAYRTLGDWSQPFFGAEQWRQRYDLARLKITQDRTLTDAQKTERLAALEQQMPADERAAQQRIDKQRAAIDQIAQLQKGATPDAMRAQLTQTLGAEAAARVAPAAGRRIVAKPLYGLCGAACADRVGGPDAAGSRRADRRAAAARVHEARRSRARGIARSRGGQRAVVKRGRRGAWAPLCRAREVPRQVSLDGIRERVERGPMPSCGTHA